MSEFTVEFLPGAARDLSAVRPDFRHTLLDAIESELSTNPFPRGKIIKRLQGFKIPTYELRVRGVGENSRVVYRLEGRRVLIIMLPPRRELDRRLSRKNRSGPFAKSRRRLASGGREGAPLGLKGGPEPDGRQGLHQGVLVVRGDKMGKTLTAVFDGHVLRPDSPVDLKPNARYQVTIEREVQEAGERNAWDTLEGLIGAIQGPEDWAAEHDHYLYGTPKRGQRSSS